MCAATRHAKTGKTRQVQACTRPSPPRQKSRGGSAAQAEPRSQGETRDTTVEFLQVEIQEEPQCFPGPLPSPACGHLRARKGNTLSDLSNRPWPVAPSQQARLGARPRLGSQQVGRWWCAGWTGWTLMRAAPGAVGATGRWSGVPFLRNKSQCDSGVLSSLSTCKRALPALASPDTKDQLDSCMPNWSEWGLVVSVRPRIDVDTTAASCAVLLKKRLNSNWAYPALPRSPRGQSDKYVHLCPVQGDSERAESLKHPVGISGRPTWSISSRRTANIRLGNVPAYKHTCCNRGEAPSPAGPGGRLVATFRLH